MYNINYDTIAISKCVAQMYMYCTYTCIYTTTDSRYNEQQHHQTLSLGISELNYSGFCINPNPTLIR